MVWYPYVLPSLAGILVTNGVPHWVLGLSGQPFPSPFSSPRGIGNSSPLVNAYWGLSNLIGGGLLLAYFLPRDLFGWILVAAAAILGSTHMAIHFGKVRAGVLTSRSNS